MSSDGFIRVVNRRRRNRARKNLYVNPNISNLIGEHDYEIDDNILPRLEKAVIDVKKTSFIKDVINQLTESLANLSSNNIYEIICYGLGKFSKSRISRFQLALLLCLKTYYNPVHVYIYDPLFRPEERQILRTLGLCIIETNEEGKRVIKQDKKTLVFMPHCSYELMNNFLWANWNEGLNDCILFCNSFSKYINESLNLNSLEYSVYIKRIHPYTTEIQLENSFEPDNVFNDLNIHIFTKQNLLKVPKNFWDNREEPTKGPYRNACFNEFIIN